MEEEETKKPETSMELTLHRVMDTRHKLMYLSGVFVVVLLFLDFFLNRFDVPTSVSYLPFVFGFGAAPFFIYQYYDYTRSKAVEDRFPDLLRSLAEAQHSGITIVEAIHQAKEIDYGALNSEIQRMSAQLSWGVPFPKVIRMFEERMSGSDFIKRTVTVVLEAFESGGDIAEAMAAVASNAVLIKDLEADRQSKLAQQVVVMYVIFFMFLGMVIVLQQILGPMFSMSMSMGGGSIFGGISGGGSSVSQQFGPSYYRKMFFSMVLIQATFNGLLAGQLGEGKVVAGLKHSAVMLIAGVAIFTFALPPQDVMLDFTTSDFPVKPNTMYTLQGSAFYADGTAITGGKLTISIGGAKYDTVTGDKGVIEYKLKVPAVPDKYKVDVTLDPGKGLKLVSKSFFLTVSR